MVEMFNSVMGQQAFNCPFKCLVMLYTLSTMIPTLLNFSMAIF